jgi:class 3 adenylate cyclase
VAEVAAFVTGAPARREPDRVLLTVLFTDIVGSTKLAASLGDRRWRELLERRRAIVRDEVDRLSGLDGALGGIAVHIGARVAGKARPGEVLVTATVRDLVAGSEIEFADRGSHALKGGPGRWRLLSVTAGGSP